MMLNIVKANGKIKELTSKVEELTTFNTQLEEQVATLKQREATYTLGTQDWMTEKENLIKGHEEAIKMLRDDFDKQLKAKDNDVVNATQSAGKQAVEIVASLGVEPDTIKVETKEITAGDILATFARLTGNEKQAYYQEHRATIVKALDLDK